MSLWKVTLFAKKSWMTHAVELSWAVAADTQNSAIKQVMDDLDSSGIFIERLDAHQCYHPIALNIPPVLDTKE
jgi:hypothetical protein